MDETSDDWTDGYPMIESANSEFVSSCSLFHLVLRFILFFVSSRSSLDVADFEAQPISAASDDKLNIVNERRLYYRGGTSLTAFFLSHFKFVRKFRSWCHFESYGLYMYIKFRPRGKQSDKK